MPDRWRHLRVGLAVVTLWATVGCGDDGGTSSTGASEASADSSASRLRGDLTVFAAASLTNAFGELGDAFETASPDVDVRFNHAASSELVAQIVEGAPADVFASADPSNMAKLTDAGRHASHPTVFTTNRASIIVEAGNPEGVSGVADLADEDLIVVSCAPEVPCGRYAQQVLDKAGVTVRFRSLEENVRGVVSKVLLGEADAGIVYATDVLAAGDGADGVEIPADVNVVAEYPIAVTDEARNPAVAQAFVDFVLSDTGQAILATYGFVGP